MRLHIHGLGNLLASRVDEWKMIITNSNPKADVGDIVETAQPNTRRHLPRLPVLLWCTVREYEHQNRARHAEEDTDD